MNIWINVFGYLASICMILGYLPQAITTIRTRDTDGIALPTFSMMGLGGAFFIVQGVLIDNFPLVFTNIVTTICAMIIFGIKISNDLKKRKK
jgi:MtN3 and saliva related transmembrane protein